MADPVVPAVDVLGKFSFILRNGKCIEPRRRLGIPQRAVAALVLRSDLAARVIVGAHGLRSQVQISSLSGQPLPQLTAEVEHLSLVIEIGGMPVRVNTTDAGFLALLLDRYAGFVSSSEAAEIEFDVDLRSPQSIDPDADIRVTQKAGRWKLERGDFQAEWEPAKRRGWIRQTANPYSINAVLRIVHTLVLARQGGVLLHSRAFIARLRKIIYPPLDSISQYAREEAQQGKSRANPSVFRLCWHSSRCNRVMRAFCLPAN